MDNEQHANLAKPLLKTSLEHLRIKKVESSDEEDSEDDQEALEIKYGGGGTHMEFGSIANQEIPDIELLEEVNNKERPFFHSRQPSREKHRLLGLTEIENNPDFDFSRTHHEKIQGL